MFTSISGQVKIQLEEGNNKNRGKFRRFSREVCGAVYDVPEGHKVIFSYEKKNGKTHQTGQMSFSVADLYMKEPEECFDTEYYPQISFLFVHRDFQCQGLGRKLLEEGIKIIKQHCNCRPVRLQSGGDSVGFFEKCGFRAVAEPYQCADSGSRLFRTLTNMQFELTSLT